MGWPWEFYGQVNETIEIGLANLYMYDMTWAFTASIWQMGLKQFVSS